MNIDLSKANLTFQELWEIKTRVIAMRDVIIQKRNLRLSELKDLELEKIVEKFSFKSMQAEYQEFCPMLINDKKCHDLKAEDLSCYGCICPNYDFEIGFDEKQNLYKIGFCRVNSKEGFYKLTQTREGTPKEYLIWNCVNCNIPHNKAFVEKEVKKSLRNII
ncbi:MAG: hypothetical protein A2255_02380 [Candidatus Melainabacteria bacterium RIFOXYA2_FULL_32_9]|nr:MAG: hypothetical protein A2255_02380 [Candidatus Melainabacteria bacterium RIFOXYA2_FULL_32_9]